MNKTTLNALNKKCESIQTEAVELAIQIAINESDSPTSELTEAHSLGSSSSDHILSMVYQDYYHIVAQYALVFREIIPIVKKHMASIGVKDCLLEKFLFSIFKQYNEWYGNEDDDDVNEFNYDDLEKNPNVGDIVNAVKFYDLFKSMYDAEDTDIDFVEYMLNLEHLGMRKLYERLESKIETPEYEFIPKMSVETYVKEWEYLFYIAGILDPYWCKKEWFVCHDEDEKDGDHNED